MKVSELLAIRRQQWEELERLCLLIETRQRSKISADVVTRFSSLYRTACADLALADQNRFPQTTINYLHQLVGRAHNQLYRSRRFDLSSWQDTMLIEVPKRIFNDRCVQLAFVLFWGAFLTATGLAVSQELWPGFAERVLSDATIERLTADFQEPLSGRPSETNMIMAAQYILHNTGTGLRCFAGGLLVIPGLIIILFNAISIGASFGYMARPDIPAGENFYEFVTAHGPFELTAIVLSAGAGLRLGMAWMRTGGLSRGSSLRQAARHAMPLMGAAMALFFMAALIEGFVSPAALPYWFKAAIAVLTSGALMFYFVILGYPRET